MIYIKKENEKNKNGEYELPTAFDEYVKKTKNRTGGTVPKELVIVRNWKKLGVYEENINLIIHLMKMGRTAGEIVEHFTIGEDKNGNPLRMSNQTFNKLKKLPEIQEYILSGYNCPKGYITEITKTFIDSILGKLSHNGKPLPPDNKMMFATLQQLDPLNWNKAKGELEIGDAQVKHEKELERVQNIFSNILKDEKTRDDELNVEDDE